MKTRKWIAWLLVAVMAASFFSLSVSAADPYGKMVAADLIATYENPSGGWGAGTMRLCAFDASENAYRKTTQGTELFFNLGWDHEDSGVIYWRATQDNLFEVASGRKVVDGKPISAWLEEGDSLKMCFESTSGARTYFDYEVPTGIDSSVTAEMTSDTEVTLTFASTPDLGAGTLWARPYTERTFDHFLYDQNGSVVQLALAWTGAEGNQVRFGKAADVTVDLFDVLTGNYTVGDGLLRDSFTEDERMMLCFEPASGERRWIELSVPTPQPDETVSAAMTGLNEVTLTFANTPDLGAGTLRVAAFDPQSRTGLVYKADGSLIQFDMGWTGADGNRVRFKLLDESLSLFDLLRGKIAVDGAPLSDLLIGGRRMMLLFDSTDGSRRWIPIASPVSAPDETVSAAMTGINEVTLTFANTPDLGEGMLRVGAFDPDLFGGLMTDASGSPICYNMAWTGADGNRVRFKLSDDSLSLYDLLRGKVAVDGAPLSEKLTGEKRIMLFFDPVSGPRRWISVSVAETAIDPTVTGEMTGSNTVTLTFPGAPDLGAGTLRVGLYDPNLFGGLVYKADGSPIQFDMGWQGEDATHMRFGLTDSSLNLLEILRGRVLIDGSPLSSLLTGERQICLLFDAQNGTRRWFTVSIPSPALDLNVTGEMTGINEVTLTFANTPDLGEGTLRVGAFDPEIVGGLMTDASGNPICYDMAWTGASGNQVRFKLTNESLSLRDVLSGKIEVDGAPLSEKMTGERKIHLFFDSVSGARRWFRVSYSVPSVDETVTAVMTGHNEMTLTFANTPDLGEGILRVAPFDPDSFDGRLFNAAGQPIQYNMGWTGASGNQVRFALTESNVNLYDAVRALVEVDGAPLSEKLTGERRMMLCFESTSGKHRWIAFSLPAPIEFDTTVLAQMTDLNIVTLTFPETNNLGAGTLWVRGFSSREPDGLVYSEAGNPVQWPMGWSGERGNRVRFAMNDSSADLLGILSGTVSFDGKPIREVLGENGKIALCFESATGSRRWFDVSIAAAGVDSSVTGLMTDPDAMVLTFENTPDLGEGTLCLRPYDADSFNHLVYSESGRVVEFPLAWKGASGNQVIFGMASEASMYDVATGRALFEGKPLSDYLGEGDSMMLCFEPTGMDRRWFGFAIGSIRRDTEVKGFLLNENQLAMRFPHPSSLGEGMLWLRLLDESGFGDVTVLPDGTPVQVPLRWVSAYGNDINFRLGDDVRGVSLADVLAGKIAFGDRLLSDLIDENHRLMLCFETTAGQRTWYEIAQSSVTVTDPHIVSATVINETQVVVVFSEAVKIVGNPFLAIRLCGTGSELAWVDGKPLQLTGGWSVSESAPNMLLWTLDTQNDLGVTSLLSLLDENGKMPDYPELSALFCIEENLGGQSDPCDGTIEGVIGESGNKLYANKIGPGADHDGAYAALIVSPGGSPFTGDPIAIPIALAAFGLAACAGLVVLRRRKSCRH